MTTRNLISPIKSKFLYLTIAEGVCQKVSVFSVLMTLLAIYPNKESYWRNLNIYRNWYNNN